ncbi:unnamed protein product [Durusdinium trenchii]|uniref:Uncharacterized protein n=2 Tax=Durusdinium trenchii TaxID=1381693 RepID=A0ABP0Q5E0_9DINO
MPLFVLQVARQLHALWVPVLFGSISAGIRTTNLSYLGLNFFAQQHTDLRPEDIRCEDTPEAPYCQAAINDNLFWATTIGAIGSLLHFVLGPFLGALSDSIGRRPVILLCSLLGYPSLVSLALFVYRNVSMYFTFALMPLGELPVLAIWFAFIVDLIEDNRDSSVAFGLVSAVALLSTMLGAGIGAFLSMKSGVAAMIFFDMGILLPYLVCCLPETLVPAKRQAMQWRAAAPGLGLRYQTMKVALLSVVSQGILVRNQLFMQLSTLVIGSTFIGTGFQRVSSSFLQKYIRWPKHCNNVAIIIGGASSIVWTGFGLSITSKIMGDVGSLGLALWAGAFYMLCFAFITTQWHVYILNAVLLGPQALAFPATSAIKSRLVAESEQGLLQGALNTGKSIAESVGPILFGFLFEVFSAPFDGHDSHTTKVSARIPILLAFLLSLPLLCLAAMLPQKLASFELQLREQLREQSVQIEMEIFEAEDVSLLDPTQRDKLL